MRRLLRTLQRASANERSRRGPPPPPGLERPSAKREDARSRRGSRRRRGRAPEREARGREESEGLDHPPSSTPCPFSLLLLQNQVGRAGRQSEWPSMATILICSPRPEPWRWSEIVSVCPSVCL